MKPAAVPPGNPMTVAELEAPLAAKARRTQRVYTGIAIAVGTVGVAVMIALYAASFIFTGC